LFLTSLSSDAKDATFLLKLNFFSVRSFSRGSKSGEDAEHDRMDFSETDIAKPPNQTEKKIYTQKARAQILGRCSNFTKNKQDGSQEASYEQDKNKGAQLFFDQTKHPGSLTISPVSQVSRSRPVAFTAENNFSILGADKDGDACYMQRVALKLLL
jgi:hypothetical protein